MTHSASAEVDVIIPTRDRPAQLAKCLTALAGQDFDHFGVIVVDDGGKVPAEQAAPELVRQQLAVHFIRNDAPIGPGPSRNRGVEASEAPLIVFLDDDCVAVPTLLSRHRASLADGAAVSLGPILPPPGQRLPAWTQWDADRLAREYRRLASDEVRPGWRHLYTGNVGLRRADFMNVGGFDHRFARQEDVELGYRLARSGCVFRFDPGAVVWHDSDRSLHTWLAIPAASARFDVLMDTLVPDSGRLVAAREELTTRHWALRLTRSVARAPIARRSTVNAAIGAGRLLHAARVDRVALSAFSVAWDLTYSGALEEAALAAHGSQPRP